MNAWPIGPVQKIIAAVSAETGVPVGAIQSPQRLREIVRARHVAMLIAWNRLPNWEAKRIARVFGRDRSTVETGVAKIAVRVEQEPKVRDLVARVIARLEGAQEGTV